VKFGKRKPARFRRITVIYLGEPVDMEYDFLKTYVAFNAVRGELESEEIDRVKVAMIKALSRSLTRWEIDDENGNIIPISEESFNLLQGRLINVIFDAISDDLEKEAEIQEKRRKR